MRAFIVCIALVLSLFTNFGYAEDDKEDKKTRGVYFRIEPDVVVNYGETGPLRFIRTNISLGIDNPQSVVKIRQHKAYIRHNIIMFLSAQSPDVIRDPNSREALRTQLLSNIKELMQMLEGEPYVTQLYFTNFIVQS